jgi:hypothetical protein
MIVSVACGLRTVVNWLRLYSQRQGDPLGEWLAELREQMRKRLRDRFADRSNRKTTRRDPQRGHFNRHSSIETGNAAPRERVKIEADARLALATCLRSLTCPMHSGR